jgi:asparagine synthase (glutamine-hydrolysing)
MLKTNLINASQWPSTQLGKKIIYSPNLPSFQPQSNPLTQEAFWEQLQTPFACVIYDTISQDITTLRDHFGVEPFYYHFTKNQFIFGSSLPAILTHLKAPLTLNTLQITNLFFNKLFNNERYSDETYYQSIYRVEPGHKLKFHKHRKPQKTSFWNLKEHTTIVYPNKNDYIDHFSELFSEALRMQVKQEKFAVEFSGGMDSSAIAACAVYSHMHPELFMHISPNPSDIPDDRYYADEVIRHLGIKSVNYVDASQFDLIKSMDECAHYFAGGAPYLEPILANNVHRQIIAKGHTLALSGVGGDECASNHAPIKICLTQYKKEHGYKQAWKELQAHYHLKECAPNHQLKEILHFIKLAHPKFFGLLKALGEPSYFLKTYLKNQPKPYHSLRDYEYDRLQGKSSHHLRMRIEYNTVAAKALGFRYAYPLLYPKLVEFCYSLPLEQKRCNGQNRYLIRNYLARFLPKTLYDNHRKTGAVTPATLTKIQTAYKEGAYTKSFSNLPFEKERCFIEKRIQQSEQQLFFHHIPSFMFKTYWSK